MQVPLRDHQYPHHPVSCHLPLMSPLLIENHVSVGHDVEQSLAELDISILWQVILGETHHNE